MFALHLMTVLPVLIILGVAEKYGFLDSITTVGVAVDKIITETFGVMLAIELGMVKYLYRYFVTFSSPHFKSQII